MLQLGIIAGCGGSKPHEPARGVAVSVRRGVSVSGFVVAVAVATWPALAQSEPAEDTDTATTARALLAGPDIHTFAVVESLAGGLNAPSMLRPGPARRGLAPSCLEERDGSLVHKAACQLPPGPTTPTDTTGTGETGTGGTDTGAGGTDTSGTGTGGDSTGTQSPGFAYHPPGDIVTLEKHVGRPNDRFVYLKGIRMPLKLGPGEHVHMNSQIFGHGGNGWGGKGKIGGSESDPRNFDPMKQRDNFCEVRGWKMPLCPAGAGHQGQDIRPPSYKDNHWEVVAVVDGTITSVSTSTSVQLKGPDGTDYIYLHMHPKSIKVSNGQQVKQGDVLGRVGKYMGGKPQTSLHLHFQARQRIKVGNETLSVYVPVYSSLVAAYRRDKGLPDGVDADGNLGIDPALEIGAAPPAPEPTPPEPEPAPPEPAPPEPAPQPEPAPPEPAPQPEPPPPEPAPQPEPAPPEPAPQPSPDQSTWRSVWDTVTGLWGKIWK